MTRPPNGGPNQGPLHIGNTGIGTTAPQATLHILENPPTLSLLTITPDFIIHCRHEHPNPWRRFWYWALLGWKWQKPPKAPSKGTSL